MSLKLQQSEVNKMDTKQKTIYCTIVLVLFTSGVVLNGEIIEENSCSVNVTAGLIVAMKESKMEAQASVFASLNVTTSAQCRESCCMEDNCSIFMYLTDSSYQQKLHANCFLVNCVPAEKCKYRSLSGCEVGVKMAQLITAIPPESKPSSPPEGGITTGEETVTNPVTTEFPFSQEASKPSVALTMAPQELNNTIIENQNPAVPKISSEKFTQDAGLQSAVFPSTVSDQTKVVSSQISSQGNESPPTEAASSTDSSPFVSANKIPGDPKHTHTNTASLVIALIFGIVFLTASTVLLGRRWWESFRRRRAFSKVDYLLNGL